MPLQAVDATTKTEDPTIIAWRTAAMKEFDPAELDIYCFHRHCGVVGESVDGDLVEVMLRRFARTGRGA